MKRECGVPLIAPPLVLPHENQRLEESKEIVRMGGRMGNQIKQLKEGEIPGQISEVAKSDSDDVGEEDLSYISGDERELNESV